jgi:hypothetical protein
MWSMVFSVMVVVVSYVHTGIRLFDPTAEFSRKYFRAVPGSYVKRLLYFMEVRALRRGIRATIWTVPYLIVLAGYASVRAMYDIAESMLGEIIWLTFAIVSSSTPFEPRYLLTTAYQAWGTLKVWDTRALAWATQLDNGDIIFKNTYNDDDTWSFGQILPMVLLLLPILSMFQSYCQCQSFRRPTDCTLTAHSGQRCKSTGCNQPSSQPVDDATRKSSTNGTPCRRTPRHRNRRRGNTHHTHHTHHTQTDLYNGLELRSAFADYTLVTCRNYRSLFTPTPPALRIATLLRSRPQHNCRSSPPLSFPLLYQPPLVSRPPLPPRMPGPHDRRCDNVGARRPRIHPGHFIHPAQPAVHHRDLRICTIGQYHAPCVMVSCCEYSAED